MEENKPIHNEEDTKPPNYRCGQWKKCFTANHFKIR